MKRPFRLELGNAEGTPATYATKAAAYDKLRELALTPGTRWKIVENRRVESVIPGRMCTRRFVIAEGVS